MLLTTERTWSTIYKSYSEIVVRKVPYPLCVPVICILFCSLPPLCLVPELLQQVLVT